MLGGAGACSETPGSEGVQRHEVVVILNSDPRSTSASTASKSQNRLGNLSQRCLPSGCAAECGMKSARDGYDLRETTE